MRRRSNKFRLRLVELGRMKPWPAWFDEFHSHLQTYKAEHGDCEVPHNYKCEDGYRLGNKVGRIRSARKRPSNRVLTEEMSTALDAIGFDWLAPKDRWFQKFRVRLVEYMTAHDGQNPPVPYECPDGYTLGKTAAAVRAAKRARALNKKAFRQLTDEIIADLDALGFEWEPSEWFPDFVQRLREYKAEHGNCSIPVKFECADGHKLGLRVQRIRTSIRRLEEGSDESMPLQVTPEMVLKLDALGFERDRNLTGKWFPKYLSHLTKFYREHGDSMVPRGYCCRDGYKLGAMTNSVREGRRDATGRRKITLPMVADLAALDFMWDVRITGSSRPPTE